MSNENAWHQPRVQRRPLRYWWWRLFSGPVVAAWRAAHQHKLPTFCPKTGTRLTYTYQLFTPEFNSVSGAALGTRGVMVEAYPWTGGTIYQWLPLRTQPDLFVEPRDRALAPDEWEGRLEATISVLVKL